MGVEAPETGQRVIRMRVMAILPKPVVAVESHGVRGKPKLKLGPGRASFRYHRWRAGTCDAFGFVLSNPEEY